MTLGSLSRWYLNAIATEYPAGVTADGDLDDARSPIRLYNADMSMRQRIDTDTTGYQYDNSIYGASLYYGEEIRVTVDDEQTESVELTEAVAVSVSLNSDAEDRAVRDVHDPPRESALEAVHRRDGGLDDGRIERAERRRSQRNRDGAVKHPRDTEWHRDHEADPRLFEDAP